MQSYTPVTITCPVASLVSSATKVIGFESDAIVNTSNLFDDVLISGRITTGTTPQAGRTIDIWAYAQIDDTPTYPDVLDGTNSSETFLTENLRNTSMQLLAQIVVDSAANRTYPFGPVSLAAAFGAVPRRWGIFVTHDTGDPLNATAGNHSFAGMGIRF